MFKKLAKGSSIAFEWGGILSHDAELSLLHISSVHQELLNSWLKYCRLQDWIACNGNLNLRLPAAIGEACVKSTGSSWGGTECARQISDAAELGAKVYWKEAV